MKRVLFFCLAICFVSLSTVKAQPAYQLPPNQPEQDACHAIQLCGNSFTTPYSYIGTGSTLDLDETPCLMQTGGGEKNSVWLEVHIATAGYLVFKIKPVNKDDDYDFAVINITGKSCSSISVNDVVRCNYNNNFPGSNVDGIIGLSDTARTPYIQNGTFGESLGQAVLAKSDDVYLILINNYGNYVNGGPSKGFTIDFSGSSSVFYNTESPKLNSVDVPCTNAGSVLVKLSAPVLCKSIAADGSDFTTNAPVKIISAEGVNCTDRGGYSNSVRLTFSSVLPDGNYTISGKSGTDNNSLAGLCDGNPLAPGSISFIVQKNSKVVVENESVCYQDLPYLWHGLTINGNDSGEVYTTLSEEGCDSLTILNLHVSEAPQSSNQSVSICDGDFYILPWGATADRAGTYTYHYKNSNGCDSLTENITVTVTIPTGGNVETRDSTFQTGFCKNGSVMLRPQNSFESYLWNTGQTSATITVNIAGAYSLLAKDRFGCTTIDTFAVAAYERPTADFKSTENLCIDSIKTLDAGSGYTSYLWNNGSTDQTITVNHPGKFWVTLINTFNCTATDTVNVVTVQRPSNFLIPDITKCSYKTTNLSSPNNFSSYTWSNGSNARIITVSAPGLYWLTVTDFHECTGRDSVTVIDSTCYEYFQIPTAFTPNHDFHDDIFRPRFAGSLTGYHFSIYNRWGKLMFSSVDPLHGWDGTVNGSQQQNGVYMWICSYLLNKKPYTEKGTVTLIR